MGSFDDDFSGDMQLDFSDDNLDYDWGDDEVPTNRDENYDEEDFLEGMEPSKKSMSIFFLIDTSGSMEGTKIGTVNSTMEELLPELIGIGGAETDISIGVMKYSSNCEWVTKDMYGNPATVRVEEYQNWERLPASGLTAMGAAFKELCGKLSRSAFMNKPSLSYAPVLFLMSDGAPTDDYKSGLKMLQKNNWFRYGLKIAVGIGSKPDMDVLREFTGNAELAVQAHDARQLKALITLLAVTSSQIGSKSMSLTEEGRERTAEEVYGDKERRLTEEIKRATDIMPDDPSTELVFDEGW